MPVFEFNINRRHPVSFNVIRLGIMLRATEHVFRNLANAKRQKIVRAAFTDGKVLSRFIAKDVQRDVGNN